MRLPVICGVIDRRILANFRVDPDVLSRALPKPFRPQIVNGFGIAGICLIRLKRIRPSFLPPVTGLASENAAHRIAIQWDTNGRTRSGVFIPRRDTSSLLNTIAGGRIFPGVHHRAHFRVVEEGLRYRVEMDSRDSSAHVLVDGEIADQLPPDSIFTSVEDVSHFFQSGSLGYSPAANNGHFDGLELISSNWHVQPLAVSSIESSFFDDREIFPTGSVVFDNALVMRGIDHEWHGRESLCCSAASGVSSAGQA